MEKPVIVDLKPMGVEMKKDELLMWCSCGLSGNQPSCDGSHAGTGFAPKVFKVEEKKRHALCCCKRTGNSPFCDGSHSGL